MGTICYDVEPAESADSFRILYVSSSRYDQTWHSIAHTHGNAELFYCVTGQGRFQVQNEHIPVHADDLIVVNPLVEHTEYAIREAGLDYIVLGVQGVEFFTPEGESVSYRSMNYTDNRRELLPYFHDLVAEASRKRPHYAEVCQFILKVLLIKLKRHEQFDIEYVTASAGGSAVCAAIKRFLDDHYSDAIDLDMLAEQNHISKYYLAHSFQREFGVSPMNYLMQRRMREARHLLANTNHHLSDIGFMLGFSSQSYFSQCFHRLVGVTPRQYRANPWHSSDKEDAQQQQQG